MYNEQSYEYFRKIREDKVTTIGSIELELPNVLNEDKMDTIDLSKLGKCRIDVYGGEGSVPHIHIQGKNIDTCINLIGDSYFDHGKHTSKLSGNNEKLIKNWFKKENDNPTTKKLAKTMYDLARLNWNVKNEDNKIADNIKKPDYEKFMSYKEWKEQNKEMAKKYQKKK